MEKHVNLLGILFIVWGVMGLLGALTVGAVFVGGGLIAGSQSGEHEVTMLAGSFGAFIMLVILLTSIPSLIAGYGLTKLRPWARIVALVVGIINLPAAPFGTALGIYAIWVLIHDDTIALFEAAGPRGSA
jgi:hypothetical protein